MMRQRMPHNTRYQHHVQPWFTHWCMTPSAAELRARWALTSWHTADTIKSASPRAALNAPLRRRASVAAAFIATFTASLRHRRGSTSAAGAADTSSLVAFSSVAMAAAAAGAADVGGVPGHGPIHTSPNPVCAVVNLEGGQNARRSCNACRLLSRLKNLVRQTPPQTHSEATACAMVLHHTHGDAELQRIQSQCTPATESGVTAHEVTGPVPCTHYLTYLAKCGAPPCGACLSTMLQ